MGDQIEKIVDVELARRPSGTVQYSTVQYSTVIESDLNVLIKLATIGTE